MTVTSCKDVLARLSSFLDARLPAGEQGEVQRHLDACVPCQEERAALERTDALVMAALSDHPFTDAGVQELLGKLPLSTLGQSARLERAPVRRFRPAGGMGVALAAAALLVGLGLGLTTTDSPAAGDPVAAPNEVLAQANAGILVLGEDGSSTIVKDTPIRAGDRVVALETPASISLPDGSQVVLHADTEVKLRRDRDGGITVEMARSEGKVYCEVAKRQRPFRVAARGLEVSVLGTRFLVDQASRFATVTVVSGRVLAAAGPDRRILTADEQAQAVFGPRAEVRLACSQVTARLFGPWVPKLIQEQSEIDRATARPTAPTAPSQPVQRPPQQQPPVDHGLDQPIPPPTPAGQEPRSGPPSGR